MSVLRRSPQRCVPVRLVDVPKATRLAAAHRAIKVETDPDVRLEIMLLAERPPRSLVAWIRP